MTSYIWDNIWQCLLVAEVLVSFYGAASLACHAAGTGHDTIPHHIRKRSTLNCISQLKWRIKQYEHICITNISVTLQAQLATITSCYFGCKWHFIKIKFTQACSYCLILQLYCEI